MVKASEQDETKNNLDPERISCLVDKWRERLGLGTQWTIGVKIYNERKDGRKGYRDCLAFTEVEEAYFNADISFNGWRFPNKEDSFVDLVVCHEVLHILLHKLEHLTDEALQDEHLSTILKENVVELISRALVNLQDSAR